jgi:hypothetical protein
MSLCFPRIDALLKAGRATGLNAHHRREVFLDRVEMAEFDPDELESLMVTAFQMLGKPEEEAQELARAILRAAERPQSVDQEPPDRGLQ